MDTNDDLARALGLTASTDPFVVCWRDLEVTDAREELERLTDWVTWTIHRYRLDHKVIPPCWPEHDPLAFHRDLTLALRRLRDWSSLLGCTRTNHRPERFD